MDPQQQQIEENDHVFAKLDSYPWDADAEFQSGLRAILGSATSPSQIQSLTIRARCFYYSRKNNNVPVDFEAYKSHVISLPLQPEQSSVTKTQSQALPCTTSTAQIKQESTVMDEASNDVPNPKYPTTFAQLVAMIQTGQEIPGIKEIPPTVLSQQATKPSASKRRKPWEIRLDDSELVNEKVEGTFGDNRDRVIVQEYPDA